MIQYAGDVRRALEGVGEVVSNQSALVRLAVNHWPVTALMLTAWGMQLHKRYKSKDLSLYTGVLDTGAIIGPAACLMLLAKLARDAEVNPS